MKRWQIPIPNQAVSNSNIKIKRCQIPTSKSSGVKFQPQNRGLFLLQKSEKDVNRATFEREGRVIVAEKVDIESISG